MASARSIAARTSRSLRAESSRIGVASSWASSALFMLGQTFEVLARKLEAASV
jgi:hypothetical protein